MKLLCLCKLIISGGVCFCRILLVFLTEFGLCMRLATLSSEAPVYSPPPPPSSLKTYVPCTGQKSKSVLILQFFVESKTGSNESEDRTVNLEAFSDVDLVLPNFS